MCISRFLGIRSNIVNPTTAVYLHINTKGAAKPKNDGANNKILDRPHSLLLVL